MYLINLSNFSGDMEKFQGDWQRVQEFLTLHTMDGIELIRYDQAFLDDMPPDLLKGYHLKYFPTWLEFYNRDLTSTCSIIGDKATIKRLYGGLEPAALVKTYQKEFQRAREFSAKYMVFHVAHVTPEHSYTYDFKYTDLDVLDASIDLVNKAFNQESEIELLFENLWWPGLTLLDAEKTAYFIDRINYPKKGIMLDLSHLMITNPKLRTPEEGVDYILDCIENLGPLKSWIRGLHVNLSLPGEYYLEDHREKCQEMLSAPDPVERYLKNVHHIKKMDWHVPFDHPRVKEIIDLAEPEYIVYEVLSKDIDQLNDYIFKQNRSLGR